VLVTGADQHQALAVIRGLGMAGIPVLATSATPNNIGFASRYAQETALYTDPHKSTERFALDIVDLIKRHDVTIIIPAVESTLVALDRHRELIERHALLAAPDSATLDWAVDKLKTLQLAEQVGVPVPKTLSTNDLEEALAEIQNFQFPVALKPRGNSLHSSTRNQLKFKVKYARSPEELERMLRAMHRTGTLPLVQEYIQGTGVCAAALFDHGKPVVILPYQRLRELPLTGGVSVLRKTLPRDERLESFVIRLLQAKKWHGTAMVEFKHDGAKNRYTLMEINGRFPASTALSLDAGVNLPHLAYCLHAGLPMPAEKHDYRTGVQERWLQGDFRALMAHLRGTTWREAVPEARARLPSHGRAVRDFLLDFRPGMHYDEFKWHDPWPGVRETQFWLRSSARAVVGALRRLSRWSRQLAREAVKDPNP
jgi:predicted ATP-grasp superfamily ATP-dependent carboligase